jgi:hypothetical protein
MQSSGSTRGPQSAKRAGLSFSLDCRVKPGNDEGYPKRRNLAPMGIDK